MNVLLLQADTEAGVAALRGQPSFQVSLRVASLGSLVPGL